MMRSRFAVALLIAIPFLANSQGILTLEDAIRIGLEKSYSIQIAQNNLEIASNNNTFGNAGFLPRVDLGINQINSFQSWYRENVDETTTTESGYPTYTLGSGVQLSWTAFDGFAMFIRKEKFALYQQQSDLYLRMAIENTIADIAYTYYSIALNEKLALTYENQMDLSRQRLNIAREKSKIGVGFELQVLQSEVDFRADSARYISQRSHLVNLKADLNRLLTREPNIDFDVNLIIPVPSSSNIGDVFFRVKELNPTLINARLQTQLGELELNEARSSRYPVVNLTGAYNFSNVGTPQSQQVLLNRTYGPTLGIGATISLFNGFNANRRIANARIYAENQVLNLEDLSLRINNTAFKLVNNLNQAIELVKVEEKSVVLAQRNAEAAWETYQLGAISDLELRESQNKFLDAQTRLISAQMNAQVAEIEILAITGDMSGFLNK